MNRLFAIFVLALALAGFSKKPIKVDPSPSPVPTVTISPITTPAPVVGSGSLKDITAIAVLSDCSRINWKDRGHAKDAYYKGMALSWARQVCKPLPVVSSEMKKTQKSRDGKLYYTDVLAHYDLDVRTYRATPFKTLGMRTDGGVDTARAVWTLLIGLGMRESSGRPYVGRDTSMNFTSADSAESGLMQSSYGARKQSPDMEALYQKYKTDKSGCFKEVYYEGYKADSANLKNWGSESSEGYKFQKLQKECPGFAVEYAAILVRLNGGGKGEFGPLRMKVAQVEKSCETMLKKVQDYVGQHPDVCKIL